MTHQFLLQQLKKREEFDIVSCDCSIRPEWGYLVAPPHAPSDTSLYISMDAELETTMLASVLLLVPNAEERSAFVYIIKGRKNNKRKREEVEEDESIEEDDDDIEDGEVKVYEEDEDVDEDVDEDESSSSDDDDNDDDHHQQQPAMIGLLDFGEYCFHGECGSIVTVRSYRIRNAGLSDHRLEFWGATAVAPRGLLRAAWKLSQSSTSSTSSSSSLASSVSTSSLSSLSTSSSHSSLSSKGKGKGNGKAKGKASRDVSLWRHVRDRHGELSWEFEKRVVARGHETLVLPEGQLESLLADVRRFFQPETRAEFARVGSSYQRVVLLHGPTGTGKDSTVQFVATALGMDVFRIALSNTKPNELSTLLRCAKKRIFLIENIETEQTSTLISPDLLSALSSISTSEGALIFLTTSADRTYLDAELTRPCRIDIEIELKPCTSEQARRLARLYAPRASDDLVDAVAEVCTRPGVAVTPAILQRALFRRATDSPDVEDTIDIIVAIARDEQRARKSQMYS